MIIKDKKVINKIEEIIKRKNEESYLEKEELERLRVFFEDPNPKKILNSIVLGERITKNIGAMFPIFDILRHQNGWIVKFFKVTGINITIPLKKEINYIEIKINFESPMYFNHTPHSYRGNIIYNHVEKYIRKIIPDMLDPKLVSKLSLKRILITEIMEDTEECTFTIDSNEKKFIIKDITEFKGIDYPLIFMITKNFENNKINTNAIIGFVRKNDNNILYNLNQYQFSKKNILKKLFPLIKKNWFFSSDLTISFISSQNVLDSEILIEAINTFNNKASFIEMLKNNKKILKKFENDPDILLLLKLQ